MANGDLNLPDLRENSAGLLQILQQIQTTATKSFASVGASIKKAADESDLLSAVSKASFGDFSAASNYAANMMQSLGGKILEVLPSSQQLATLAKTLGNQFLTAGTQLTGFVNPLSVMGFQAFSNITRLDLLAEAVNTTNSATTSAATGGIALANESLSAMANGTGLLNSTFTATAASSTATLEMLKAGFVDTKGALAEAGQGMLSEMMGTINSFFAQIQSTVQTEGLGGLAASFGTIAANCVIALQEQIPALIEAAEQMVLSFVIGITDNAEDIGIGAVEIVTQLAQGILAAVPPLAEAGGALIAEIVKGLTNNLPELLTGAGEVVGGLIDTLTGSMDQIFSLGAELIASIAEGLSGAIPDLVAKIPDLVSSFTGSLHDFLPDILESGCEIIFALADGLIQALPSLIEELPNIINNMVNCFTENLPKLIEMGFQLIWNLIVGILKAIPTLIMNLPQLFMALLNYFTAKKQVIINLGLDLIKGLWEGIKNAAGWLIGKLKEWCGSIVDAIKGFFGIHSPSRVFSEEIGKPIAQGIAVGITSEEDAVRSAAAEVVDAAIDEANRRISRDENGNMLVEGLQVGITVGEDFGKDVMDAAVKNLKLQLDTAAITTADYYRELEKLRDNYLTRGSEEWWKYTKEVMEYEQKRVEEAKKANKEAFEEELHLLERKQKLGLISEQEYYIGMKKLTRSYFTENEKEWQDYTEKLEDFVVKETQTLTDQVGKLLQGLYDEADKALQDVLSSMDSFRDSVSDFGNYLFHFSVKDQNGRIIDQSTGLVDFGLRQKELERFTELFKQIKALPNIPKKILEDIRKMKPEDAVRLMELMLRTPQQALQNWFQAERDFMDTIDTAADALYGDDLFAAEENIRKVDELKQNVIDMCNELGISVPASFAAMGTASKDSFFDMFKEVAGEIEGLMEQLQFTVSLSQSELTVNVEPYSGTAVTAASSSQTYAPTYYFAASGDSTARQIQAANANDTINRLRGVSF